MILTDREIKTAINEGQIQIIPTPDLSVAVTSTAMDLTLGSVFKTWPQTSGMYIRPHAEGYKYSSIAKMQEDHSGPSFDLHPQSFVLAWTKERVVLPYTSRIAARVEGKSSLARLGISIHVTAPTIHAGFQGEIQLEMYNFGPNVVVFDVGMWVCQLIFEQTFGTPQQGYGGGFADQASTGFKSK